MPTRVLLVRRGCPYCLRAIKAVLHVNKFLPDLKKIQIKDNFEWEEFGFKANPVMDRFDPKTFDGYPYIFIDGIEIEPTETNLLIIAIAKIVEDDLIMGVNLEGMTYPVS